MSGGSSESSPQFFKVLKGDFSQRLRIPPAFVKHIVMDPFRTAKLKGPSGRIWHAQLSRRVTGAYLQDGWKTFVEDHSLKDSEFLLFRYDGNMHFTVHIFDKTTCEREEPITCNTHEESTMDNGERKSGLPKKTAGFGQYSQHKLCKSDTKITQSDYIHSPKTSPWNNVDSTPGQHMRMIKNSSFKKIKADDAGLTRCRTYSYATGVGHISERLPLKLEERADTFEKANMFSKTCKFPYFLKLMQKSSVGGSSLLSVPSSFTKEHRFGERMTLSLKDPRGRSWEVIYIQKGEGKASLSGGWASFSAGNNLKVGDICIFELVGKCRLEVHIFHLEASSSSREEASENSKTVNRAS